MPRPMALTGGLTKNDGHEIGGQDIYRLKIDYITMQCSVIHTHNHLDVSATYRAAEAHTDESVDTSTAAV